ncbi:MAG: aldehyde dehydrogenase family protein [Paracoccaceae bacterium]|nr:aldehyde dehydrogenase family protein [Paracoccaceae bacterium]
MLHILIHVTNLCRYSIEAGNLSINMLEEPIPETIFGGIKSSCYGHECGSEGLGNYIIIKNV